MSGVWVVGTGWAAGLQSVSEARFGSVWTRSVCFVLALRFRACRPCVAVVLR